MIGLDLLSPLFPPGNGPVRLGVGEARRNRIPRWLVEIQRLDRNFFLSDVPGRLLDVEWPDFPEVGLPRLEDVVWEQGVYSVTDSGREIDLVDMRMPFPSVTVHLTTDLRRFFDPMTQLAESRVRVLYYDGVKVRAITRGLTDEKSFGFDGETTSFRIIEYWRVNSLFPPAKAEKGVRIPASRIIESAEAQAYPYVLGDALAVPMDPIRSQGDPLASPADEGAPEEEASTEPEINSDGAGPVRYLINGTGLTRKLQITDEARDPCPYPGFPHPEYPSLKGLVASTVRYLWYGKNRCLRDNFERTGLARKWEIFEGDAEQLGGPTNKLDTLENDTTIRWAAWTYQDTLSLALKAEPLDPSSIAVVYWNHVDADNHARVEFPFGGSEIRVVVREAGVDTTDESRECEGGLPADGFVLTVNIGTGKLTAGVISALGAPVVEFGAIAGAVGGFLAIGCKDGPVKFHFIRQPSMEPAGFTDADMNAGIRNRMDLLKHPLVCEDYKEQPGEPMHADFRRAQNVTTVGEAVDRLVRDYSGWPDVYLDESSFGQMVHELNRFTIGAYFNEQLPVFDVVTERLAKQFAFAVAPDAGYLKGMAFDPTRPAERKLVYGVDLLELAEMPTEYPKYNEFNIRFRYNRARDGAWMRTDSLSSENSAYFRNHRLRYGYNPFPRIIDLPDVVTDGTAQYLLYLYALIFHAGQRFPYRMRATPGGDIPFGQRVLLYDPERGLFDKRATLVGRTIESPEYVVNVFRTTEEFEETGAGGAAVGAPEEPEVEECVPIDGSDIPAYCPAMTCWSFSGGGSLVEGVGPDGQDGVVFPEGVTAADQSITLSCECSFTASEFTHTTAGVTSRAQSFGGIVKTYRVRVFYWVYEGENCETLVDSGSVILRSGSINGDAGWGCNFSSAVPNLEAGQTMRVRFVSDRTTIPSPFAEVTLVDPWLSTNTAGSAPDLCP